MIEIRDLYKYYGERRALGDLSFTIQSGQIVGLLGLNGAGKTTTLRILACDLLPTSGTVLVGGIDVVSNPDEVSCKNRLPAGFAAAISRNDRPRVPALRRQDSGIESGAPVHSCG